MKLSTKLLLITATAAAGAAIVVAGVFVSLAALGIAEDEARAEHIGRTGY